MVTNWATSRGACMGSEAASVTDNRAGDSSG